MSTASATNPRTAMAVRKSIVVNAPQAHAFQVFTEGMHSWWPMKSHHIGSKPAETVIFEPRVGGRYFERAADGSECLWGHVLAWEPPQRLVLSWEIAADWKHDANTGIEVEVRFLAEGRETTRVELEHRNLERYGDHAQAVRDAVDSQGGWTGILDRYIAVATGKPLPPEPEGKTA